MARWAAARLFNSAGMPLSERDPWGMLFGVTRSTCRKLVGGSSRPLVDEKGRNRDRNDDGLGLRVASVTVSRRRLLPGASSKMHCKKERGRYVVTSTQKQGLTIT